MQDQAGFASGTLSSTAPLSAPVDTVGEPPGDPSSTDYYDAQSVDARKDHGEGSDSDSNRRRLVYWLLGVAAVVALVATAFAASILMWRRQRRQRQQRRRARASGEMHENANKPHMGSFAAMEAVLILP